MKLKNLFYLLLALPMLIVSCEKEPSETPTDPSSRYFIEQDLILGCMMGDFANGRGTVTFSSEKRDVHVIVTLQGETTDTTLKPGTYSPADSRVPYSISLATSTVMYYGDNGLEYSFLDGGDATVVVGGSSSCYIIDMVLADAQKREYHFTYEGRIEGLSPALPLPTEPVSMVAENTKFTVTPSAYYELAITLSDKGWNEYSNPAAGASFYRVSLWTEPVEVDAEGYMAIPVGTYPFNAEYGVVLNTVLGRSSYFQSVSEDGTEYAMYADYEDCEVVVAEDGITITATIGGVEHVITYSGTNRLKVDSIINM